MLSQEEYMDVVALHRQGWTIGQIAESIGRHLATVSSWLKKGGPPPRRSAPVGHVPVIDDRWAARIDELLDANPELLATSVERIIRAEGYGRADRRLRAVCGWHSWQVGRRSVSGSVERNGCLVTCV